MNKDPMLDNKYYQQFKKHLEEIDPFIPVVLKSHLVMESAIDNIIRLIFFHPDYILETCMNFFHKVGILRAFALREDEMSIWDLMLAIAELRNEVAHNLEPKKRDPRMEKVRKLFLSEVMPETAKVHKDKPDDVIVILAAGFCTGFLGEYEKDLAQLRTWIDSAAAHLPRNPDGSIKKKPVKGYEEPPSKPDTR
jgi:hypothetical protein